MSFHAVVAALEVQNIDPMAKFVLVVLGSYANTDNTLWPSQVTLAADTCMSERSIRNHLTTLSEMGLIKRAHRRVGQRRTSDMITLLFVPARSAAREVSEPANGVVSTGKARHSEPANPAAKPVIEPKIEPLVRAKPLVPVESQAARAKRQEEMARGLRELASQLGSKR